MIYTIIILCIIQYNDIFFKLGFIKKQLRNIARADWNCSYRYVTVSGNSVDLVDFFEEKLGIAIAILKNDDYLKQLALVLENR